MKVIRKREIEETIEGEEIHLEGIVIAGKAYSLDIQNSRRAEGHEAVSFSFNGGEYEMTIRGEQIYFSRHVSRPNHDHDDSEDLQIRTDEISDHEKGKLFWRSRYPYPGEGYEHFKVPFGGIKVDH